MTQVLKGVWWNPASTSEGIQLDETAVGSMGIECNHEDAEEDAENQGRSRESEKRERDGPLIVALK